MNRKTFPAGYFLQVFLQQDIFHSSFPQQSFRWMAIQIAFQWDHWVIDVNPVYLDDGLKAALSELMGIRSLRNLETSHNLTWKNAERESFASPDMAGNQENTVQYFDGCQMRRWCSLFVEYCKATRTIFDATFSCLQVFCQLCVFKMATVHQCGEVNFSVVCSCFVDDVLFAFHLWRFQRLQFFFFFLKFLPTLCPLQFLLLWFWWLCWSARACVPN